MADAALERELESRVEELGYELVELERAGSRARPIFRLRVDRPDSEPGKGVTVDECARVSRALQPFMDGRPDVAERYVLEVSSPGVERPLRRRGDWLRFQGQEVALQGSGELAGRGTRRLEGRLEGLVDEEAPEGEETVRLRLPDETVVEVPREEIARAHLIFRWNE
ncbi:MAG TPA: ribosome maturation factor RimP [Longimicrobiales bacterium]|nr:ribosome maturation factor RimP [Longimicrobiales bacterium]